MKHKSIANLFLSLMLICFMTAAFKPLDAKAATENTIDDPTIVFDANSDTNPGFDVITNVGGIVTDIKVDGSIIDKTNYVINEYGHINIHYDYLIQLSAGDHEYELVMSHGNNPTGTITIPDTCKLEFISDPEMGGFAELYNSDHTCRAFGSVYYAPKGEETSFFARPQSGYSFSAYEYDGEYGYYQVHTFIPTEDMKIKLEFSKNTYKVESNVKTCDFGKVKVGYSDIKEQVVRLSNMGNAPFLLKTPELKNYDVEIRPMGEELPDPLNGEHSSDSNSFLMYPEGTVELVVKPKADLGDGKYFEDMAIVSIESSAEGIIDPQETFHFNIPLSFEVYGDKAPEVDNKDNTDVKPADVDVKTVSTEDQPIVKKGASVQPKTGDNNNIVFYSALTAFALVAAIVVVLKKKRK